MDERERLLSQTLNGLRVVVTRSGAQGAAMIKRLCELGAVGLHYPSVSVAPPHDLTELQDAVRNIHSFDWLAFTSANAVQAIAEQFLELRGSTQLMLPPIAVVGPATAATVTGLGWKVQFAPVRSSGRSLAATLPVVAGARVLLPRADIASIDVPNVLRERGCVVTEATAYRTIPDASSAQLQSVAARTVDAVTFTSPSTVDGFWAIARNVGWDIVADQQAGRLLVACIGETTAAAVRQRDLHADAVADEQSAEGLIEALADAFRRRSNPARATSQNSGSF